LWLIRAFPEIQSPFKIKMAMIISLPRKILRMPSPLVTRSMKGLLLGERNWWVSLFRYRESEDDSLVPSQFMGSISFSLLMPSVELGCELRLEAAAQLFELGFHPRHMSQQCVQLLWTQYQQSEHKYEQDFCTQTHDSPLG
jgi:hypothetical protein